MDRLRQRLHRRRSSSGSAAPLHPPKSPSLSAADRRKKEADDAPRRLYITSDTSTFDPLLLRRFKAEGFQVEYLPFPGGNDDPERERKDLEKLIHEREDDLEPGERYAILAYNKPAHLLLTSHHQSTTATNPFPRLCALVTYYPNFNSHENNPYVHYQCLIPPSMTSSSTASDYTSLSLLPIQIHLPGHQPPTLWEEYNSHPTKKRHRCHFFFYPESSPGFAEASSPGYDGVSAHLALSRTLDCLKRGFGWPGGNWNIPEVETIWEEYWRNLIYDGKDRHEAEDHAATTVNMMVGSGPTCPENSGGAIEDDPTAGLNEMPLVNCVPTMVGGNNLHDITAFYTTEFFPTGPPSQSVRLLARTLGTDRIVDEVLLSFIHTEEIPWLLPGVPPTDKPVRITLVLTAAFVAGRLARQNIYWDQASVLVQIGLLDPRLVPEGFHATGKNRARMEAVERLPVVGVEGVERVLS
ncbi:hypothetical protein FE257_001335 [Aspergillus nanangensis]|uniref:Dienelactone hydrolase n=1 Tax=Aspergillus nanangensis TaxID=2582783 RepID=A0AAD4CDZ4_ASPNN|nr:hypothetical protein FE257_001335 [Aspergillus nanangensis]